MTEVHASKLSCTSFGLQQRIWRICVQAARVHTAFFTSDFESVWSEHHATRLQERHPVLVSVEEQLTKNERQRYRRAIRFDNSSQRLHAHRFQKFLHDMLSKVGSGLVQGEEKVVVGHCQCFPNAQGVADGWVLLAGWELLKDFLESCRSSRATCLQVDVVQHAVCRKLLPRSFQPAGIEFLHAQRRSTKIRDSCTWALCVKLCSSL